MKFPNFSGKNPTSKQPSAPTPKHTQQQKPPRRVSPSTAAWLLVLTVFIAAVAYAAGGGVITLNGATSGTVTVQVPSVAGSTTFQLPGNNGTSTYVLQTDGTGVTSWVSNAGTASTALSAITAAAAAHTVANLNFAQTWTWNSLTTQTAFTLSSSSLTNGNILSIQNTAASATSTGKVLSISDATTGSGYGVYSSMTGHGNTGYAGYFINTDTSSNLNYGVYALLSSTNTSGGNPTAVYGEADCGNCVGLAGYSGSNIGVLGGGTPGVYASSTYEALEAFSSSTGSGYGVYGTITGHGNTGYAGYFINTSTTGSNFGLFGTSASASNGVGVYGTETGANATSSIAGYFQNLGGGAVLNYGVYGSTNSVYGTGVYGAQAGAGNQGIAGQFINQGGGSTWDWGVFGQTYNTGAGVGVEGQNVGAANTGFAGYFVNSGGGAVANYGVYGGTNATGAGYGVYGTITGVGNTGFAGYFTNTSTTGWSVYSAGGAWNYFSGNVGIGNSNATQPWDNLLVEETNSGGGITFQNDSSTVANYPHMYIYDYAGSVGGGGILGFGTSRGTQASPSPLQSGDVMGYLQATGQYDTTAAHMGQGAFLAFTADGNFATGSYPGRMGLFTTTSGATTPTERVRITSTGHLDFLGTAPTISACGTSPPAATGNDNVFQLTTGTAGPTACTATFNKAWANAPICHAEEFNGTVVTYISAASTTAITITFASGLTSQKVNVICRGWE